MKVGGPTMHKRIMIGGDVNVEEYFNGATMRAKDFQEKVNGIESVALDKDDREALEGRAEVGRLLKREANVIADPVYLELFMQDTSGNRADFIKIKRAGSVVS